MKRWKRMTLGALLAAVCILAMGCGKEVTVKSLFQDANKNTKDAKSIDMDVLLDLECKMEAENAATSMEFHFDVNAKMEVEKGLYMDGDAEIDLFGTNMTVPVKSYTVLDEEKSTVYTYDPNTDSWSYAEKDAEENDFAEDVVGYDFSKIYDELTLADELEDYHDKKCYRVSGKVKGAELSDLIENIEEELQQNQLDEDALEYLTAEITFYFDQKTKDLSGMYLDFSDSDWEKLSESSNTSDEMGMFGKDAKFNVPEFSMEIILNSHDDYKFKLPKDVKDQAVEDESKSENVLMNLGEDADTDTDTDNDTDGDSQSNGDAVLDKKLEIAKGNFKIDGKSYQLQSRANVLEEDGWVFDTEYNDSDMIPAEDYEIVSFSKDDKYISLYVFNESGEEKSYKECGLAGVYNTDMEAAVLELDSGIKVGSSYEDVVAVLGEPEDVYEDENYKSLDYVSASGEISLEISFYDNIVSSIMLTGDF